MEQIKKHPFFYGVDYDTIRHIEAPFVPHLRSITDTSYFPTDELEQAPEELPADSSGANKDLAFLGSARSYNPQYIRLSESIFNADTHSSGSRYRLTHSDHSVSPLSRTAGLRGVLHLHRDIIVHIIVILSRDQQKFCF